MSGRPGVGHPGEGECEGFVVGPDGELAALQVMSEMTYPGKYAIQLPVKGTVGQLGLLQLG